MDRTNRAPTGRLLFLWLLVAGVAFSGCEDEPAAPVNPHPLVSQPREVLPAADVVSAASAKLAQLSAPQPLPPEQQNISPADIKSDAAVEVVAPSQLPETTDRYQQPSTTTDRYQLPPANTDANPSANQSAAAGDGSTSPALSSPTGPDLTSPEPAQLEQSQASAELTDGNLALPWGPSAQSSEMAAIAQRAEEMARRGFNLAERGAMYSARSQFIESLRTLAAAMDAQRNTTAHMRALSAGLHAMEEVNDFVPRQSQLGTDMNFRLIIDAHHTPVLKDMPLSSMTGLEAQRMYLSYAQEQLSAAGGDQPVASLALLGLGKICTAPSEMHGPHEQIAEAKAVVFHQAALIVEPKNFMAANELGVLLTHFGKLPEARAVLEQAVAMSAGPTEWRNLASVCDRMGDAAHAANARQQADVAVARLQKSGYATAGAKYPIQWLDPASFAGTSSMVADAGSNTAAPAQSSVMSPNPASGSQAATATAAKPQPKSNGFWPWLK